MPLPERISIDQSGIEADQIEIGQVTVAGIRIAKYLLIMIGVGIIIVFADLYISNPLRSGAPTLSSSTPSEVVEFYKQMQALSIDRFTKIFTLVISSLLFPAFTTVLGYIFGRKQDSD